MAVSYDLNRFVAAQADVIADALTELHAGQKRSHWMWFVFPQLRGLGMSPTAQRYGIADLDEANAYLAHPLLGRRLFACTDIVLSIERRTLQQIFGSPDDMKFISCMTLFALASRNPQSAFRVALDRYGGGALDQRTVDMLSA
ncbi:DUF1810 domain-containing protein [Bosea sp. PAMC 26642]|uniref:DUF1810 domain-containing protein n=1 Tax=Bosea sp. (strain PAMC 26642) TaxID=1792307 RepID=UPI00076FE2B1|nr:DUF1810 domain-containing protein [Bosea sp. PAMC 26642]AMJ61415.1 calpastatin [Bosea sp. PAMC 26642]